MLKESLHCRDQQTFFVKGQKVNILSLGAIWSLLQPLNSAVKAATDNTKLSEHGWLCPITLYSWIPKPKVHTILHAMKYFFFKNFF